MGRKFGLGKGLGALIPEKPIIEESENNDNKKVNNVPLNEIKSNAKQPRKYFNDDKIKELSKSIKQYGIVQPLILRKEGEFYIIVAGERRWRAAKSLGMKEVPATIKDLTDNEVLEISLIENIQREDLNPIEEAKAYESLIKEFNLTQEELSERLGKSRTSISNTMRLINLDEIIQQFIISGDLSEGHGRAILSLKDKGNQVTFAKKIIGDKLSVRETEEQVKKLNCLNKNKKNSKDEGINIYYKDIKNKLQDYFGTKINISNKNNKGKIEIEYYSEEDFQRIIDILKI